MRFIAYSIVFFFLLTSTATFAKIYKWVDADGVIQYSTVPPKTKPAQELDIRVLKPATNPNQDAENSETTNSNLTPEELETIKKGRAITCEKAKKNLVTLQSSANVSLKTKEGEVRQLSEEERTKRAEEEQKVVNEFCN